MKQQPDGSIRSRTPNSVLFAENFNPTSINSAIIDFGTPGMIGKAHLPPTDLIMLTTYSYLSTNNGKGSN